MVTGLICFAAGLVVGWNFLPQPEFVKNFVGKAIEFVTGFFKSKDQK